MFQHQSLPFRKICPGFLVLVVFCLLTQGCEEVYQSISEKSPAVTVAVNSPYIVGWINPSKGQVVESLQQWQRQQKYRRHFQKDNGETVSSRTVLLSSLPIYQISTLAYLPEETFDEGIGITVFDAQGEKKTHFHTSSAKHSETGQLVRVCSPGAGCQNSQSPGVTLSTDRSNAVLGYFRAGQHSNPLLRKATLSFSDFNFDHSLRFEKVVYTASHHKGSIVNASALLIRPETPPDEDKPLVVLVPSFRSDKHDPDVAQVSLAANTPSMTDISTYQVNHEVIYAWMLAGKGYTVLVPDMMGFGESWGNLSNLMRRDISADVIDAIRATRQHQSAHSESISFSSDIYILGYSQGGYAATAAYLTMSRLYPSEFNVSRVFSGNAPYDVFYTVNHAAEEENSDHRVVLPQNMTRQFFRSYHSYSFKSRSETAAEVEAEHYAIYSYGFNKTVPATQGLPFSLPKRYEFRDLTSLWLSTGLKNVKILSKLNSLSLFDPPDQIGYKVSPFRGELLLFHHKNDKVVPCKNLENFLISRGPKLTMDICSQTLNSRLQLSLFLTGEIKTVDNSTCLNHQDCTFSFYQWALSKITQ